MTKKHTISFKTLFLSGLAFAVAMPALRVAAAGLPNVRAVATDPVALQGGSAGTFTVVREGDTSAGITVNYVITGTAVAGTDYIALSNSVVIPAGVASQNIAVTPTTGDTTFGSLDKTVNLTLAIGSGYNITLPAAATVTIIADRTPPAFIRIVSPIANQVFPQGASVTVSAELADPADAVKVEFFANNNSIGSVTTAPYAVTINNTPPGTYTLTAKVTDLVGHTDTSPAVTVMVNNQAPTVTLTSPTDGSTISGAPTVVLTAVASDPDDAIAKVEFRDLLGKLVGTVANGPSIVNNTYTLTLTNVSNGTHVYTAKAYDAPLDSGTVATAVSSAATVQVFNAAPVVNVVEPADGSSFDQGASVTLHAVATDADDAITEVDFYANKSTLLGSVFKVGNTDSNSFLTVPNVTPGTYAITAVAMDPYGRQTTSPSITITVNNKTPVFQGFGLVGTNLNAFGILDPPVAQMQAVVADPDDAIKQVEFLVDGQSKKTVKNDTNIVNNTYSFDYSFSHATDDGMHTLAARATDIYGAQTTSSTITVNVTDFAPNIELVSPADGATITSPPTIVFKAIAGDSDEAIDHVDFMANNKVIKTVTTGDTNIVSTVYTYNWQNLASGTYTVAARAVDIYGRVTLSGSHTVTVNNQRPTVTLVAPAQGTVYSSAPATVSFHAVATDPDDGVAEVQFYEGSTLLGTVYKVGSGMSNPDAYLTVSGVGPGNHAYYAKAYDPYGANSISPSIVISVNSALPTVTLVSPANNTTIVTPPTVDLKAVATSDSGIAKVEFYDGGVKVGTVNNGTNIVNNTYEVILTNVRSGPHTYVAKAYDIFNRSVVSGSASVTVNNVSPTVAIVSPANGAVLAYPVNNVQAQVTATDPDDGVTQVQFFVDNNLLGTSYKIGAAVTNAPNSTFTLNNLTIGTHTLSATASDPYGRQTTAQVTINVSLMPTPLPDQAATSSTKQGSSPDQTATAPATISSLVSLPDGGYQLTITGTPGAAVVVEASSNFADWTVLATVKIGTNGTVIYTDTNTSGDRRFYRLGTP